MRKKVGKQIVKEDLECHYCRKIGHVVWNCKIQAKDFLKGRLETMENRI